MKNRNALFVGSCITVLGSFAWVGCVAIAGDFDRASVAETNPATDANASDATNADAGIDSATNGTDAGNDVATNADSSADAPSDGAAIDGSEGDGNPCGFEPTTNFYVDPLNGSDSNSGGASGCALKTITAALTASAGAAHDNAIIHLAAGTYATGETFPLVVNHGRSLLGAGAGTTKIQGSAAYATSGTESFLDSVTDAGAGTNHVTIVAGDVVGGATNYGATTLSGFTLVPDATVTTPTAGYVGLACIAGNAPNTPSAGTSLPIPTANLILQRVTIGPNYDIGFAIGSSPSQSTACNPLVVQSSFTGMNTGLDTGVCGAANPLESWPSAQIGDGVGSDANTFSDCTIDIFGGGCGSFQSINYNTFSSGYRGIVIVSQAAQYFEVLSNSFTGGTSSFPMGYGLQTSSSVVISKLNKNTFTNIAESAAADTAAGGTTGFALAVASVLEAHQNVIHDNDNGIALGVAPSANSTFDFSSDGATAYANDIYCNSKPVGASGVGYDIVLSYANGMAANFSGNVMDRMTPTTGTSLTGSPNGTDVVTGTSAGATLTGTVAITTACSTSRTH